LLPPVAVLISSAEVERLLRRRVDGWTAQGRSMMTAIVSRI
jgi:hypothetical protein